MTEYKVKDSIAALAVVNAMIGSHTVGIADDEEIQVYTSPVVRAHVQAALGAMMPGYLTPFNNKMSITSIADYLQSVVDELRSIPK